MDEDGERNDEEAPPQPKKMSKSELKRIEK